MEVSPQENSTGDSSRGEWFPEPAPKPSNRGQQASQDWHPNTGVGRQRKRVSNLSIQVEAHVGGRGQGREFLGAVTREAPGDSGKGKGLRGFLSIPGNIPNCGHPAPTPCKLCGCKPQQGIAPSVRLHKDSSLPLEDPRMISKRPVETGHL